MPRLAKTGVIRGLLVGALFLLATAAQGPSAAIAAPPQQSQEVVLVNAGQDFIQRESDGGFTARPVLNVQPEVLAYGVKDPVDGAWLTALYRVQDDGRRVDEGWEYTIEYPLYPEQPALDPNRAYILVLYAQHPGGLTSFEETIPAYEPTNLWDRVIDAFNPAKWARSFASWVIEGMHGVLCSVLSRITGTDLDSCGS